MVRERNWNPGPLDCESHALSIRSLQPIPSPALKRFEEQLPYYRKHILQVLFSLFHERRSSPIKWLKSCWTMKATTLSEVTCYQRSNGKKLNETFANLLLVFAIAPRGFSSGTLIFQALTSKSNTSKFWFESEWWTKSCVVDIIPQINYFYMYRLFNCISLPRGTFVMDKRWSVYWFCRQIPKCDYSTQTVIK